MFDLESQAWADNTALGKCMGYAREFLEWILQTIWVQRDDEALWLDKWEAIFDIAQRGTTALRQSAILGRIRGYGSGTEDQMRLVFADVFDGNPDNVGFRNPTAAEITAGASLGETTYVRANNYMHIYHIPETADPDEGLARDLISYNAPTWQEWTLGRYDDLKWDTEGTYDYSTWG
jgi:hypothetical protein